MQGCRWRSLSIADWAAGVGVLGLTSLAVQDIAERLFGGPVASPFEPASLAAADNAVLRGILLAAEPGVLLFLGGLAVFLAVGLRTRVSS